MKAKRRKYWLVFHARASEAVSAEKRHSQFFERIRDLPLPWGLGERPIPPAPNFGRSSAAVIGLTAFFGDGVKRAVLNYRYRRLLQDDGLSDDTLTITLDPARVDIHHLVYEVIPRYIDAFDAYLVEFFDDKLIDLAWEESAEQRVYTNPRSQVGRVNVVSFYDETLCKRAFRLSPTEAAERLKGTVEHTRVHRGGLYVIATSQIPSLEEAERLSKDMTTALHTSRA